MKEGGNPSFLKEVYRDLSASPEVSRVVQREEKRTGLRVPEKPEVKIQTYLGYLQESLDPNNPRRDEKMAKLKIALYQEYVIKPEDVPDEYFETQKRLYREEGRGDIEITSDMKKQLIEVIIADQKGRLDLWIDYLASYDAKYPDWLKYWAIRSILGMGEYDKEKKSFTKRRKDTVKPFPDLDHEALAYVLDAMKKRYGPQLAEEEALEKLEKTDQREEPFNDEQKMELAEQKALFEKLLAGKSFSRLYAWAIEKATPATREQLTNTDGQWVMYDKDSDHMPLVKSLQGHGTGWCTAGEETAKIHLEGGDFHVYYSMDRKGNPTVPRAAIRMEGHQIAEVRGIAEKQNLDQYIGDVVRNKLATFPDGKLYEKRCRDMKRVTEIEAKVKSKQELSDEELRFIYEIDSPIRGFGYGADPRIREIMRMRDFKKDCPAIFGCSADEIVNHNNWMTAPGKIYKGYMFPNIFQKLTGMDRIYDGDAFHLSLSEREATRFSIQVGGKSAAVLIDELNQHDVVLYDQVEDMMKKKQFSVGEKAEEIDLVTIAKPVFGNMLFTTAGMIDKARGLGLSLCPPDAAAQFCLQNPDVDYPGYYVFVSETIVPGKGKKPSYFVVARNQEGKLYMVDYTANPPHGWVDNVRFVFQARRAKEKEAVDLGDIRKLSRKIKNLYDKITELIYQEEVRGKKKTGKQWMTPEEIKQVYFLYSLDSNKLPKETRTSLWCLIRYREKYAAYDAAVCLGYQESEVATKPSQITADTKVYIGPLFPKFWKKIPQLEHFKQGFPGRDIDAETLVATGSKSLDVKVKELKKNGVVVEDDVKTLLETAHVTPNDSKKTVSVIRINLLALGFSIGAKYDEILEKAKSLGLQICPPEIALEYSSRVQSNPLPEDKCVVLTKPFTDIQRGHEHLFEVNKNMAGTNVKIYYLDRRYASFQSTDEVLLMVPQDK